MTDKDKIRKEVERLMNELIQEKRKGYGSVVDDVCILELQNILTYIDCLKKEPVNVVWHKYRKNDKPFLGMEIVVCKNNKLYYGKYISAAYYNFVFVQIVFEDETAFAYLNYDILTNGDEWAYFDDTQKLSNIQRTIKNWKKPVSEDLEKASIIHSEIVRNTSVIDEDFIAGAKWKEHHLWKPADGDDLPKIDREVIVLCKNGRVAFGHRPVESGWNIPNVKWWLDCDLPNEIEK